MAPSEPRDDRPALDDPGAAAAAPTNGGTADADVAGAAPPEPTTTADAAADAAPTDGVAPEAPVVAAPAAPAAEEHGDELAAETTEDATSAPPAAPERLVPEEDLTLPPEDVSDFLINVGPHHPGTHGVLRLVTRLDGETVVGLDVRIGYMHRSLEKIAENRTFHQILAFTDRTADYLAAMHNDWVYCLAAERLLGIQVPERAEYLRIITGEMNRMASHLMSIGALGLDTGATTYFLWCFAARERLIRQFEELCGARLTYVFHRLGGVGYDTPPGWVERTGEVVHGVIDEVPRFRALFHDNYIWHKRSKGISRLSAEEALRLGAQGPTLRAAGVRWDLRRDMPYSIYDRFDFEVPVGETGDVYDRTEVRLQELIESAKIIRQALQDLPAGDIMAKRVPRLPEAPAHAEAYARLESPRGEIGCYLVGDGGILPRRMKWRGASFHNLAMLPAMAVGYTLSDLINIVGTLDPVMGDVDR